MSENFPALKNLGINRPHEISGYSLSSFNHVDTLRIRYNRKKGSLLPTSKKFQFPRRPTPGMQAAGAEFMEEISPALGDALNELSLLLDEKQHNSNRKQLLIDELDEFGAFVRSRLAEFKAEIEKL